MRVSAEYRKDTEGVVYANNVVIYDPKLQEQPEINQKTLVRIYGSRFHKLTLENKVFLQQLIEGLAEPENENKEVKQ